MFGLLGNKVAKSQLDNATKQILELETIKKRLEIERDQIKLENDNQRRRVDMKLEEESHKQKLELESEKALFNRERNVWEIEKQELISKYKREFQDLELRLKKDHEIKLLEAVTLAKLESQQQVAQAKLDANREVNEVRAAMAEKVSTIQQEESVKHYKNLTEAFQEMQLNGDKNSKFVQEMALKLMDKTPTSRSQFDVSVSTNPQLVSKNEQQ